MAQGQQSYDDALSTQRRIAQQQAAASWTGSAPNWSGSLVQWVNAVGSVVGWGPFPTANSLQSAVSFTLYGHYVGWTISGTDLPWDLVEIAVDFDMGREW